MIVLRRVLTHVVVVVHRRTNQQCMSVLRDAAGLQVFDLPNMFLHQVAMALYLAENSEQVSVKTPAASRHPEQGPVISLDLSSHEMAAA